MAQDEKQGGDYHIENMRVPETPPAGEAPAPWKDTAVVGTRRPRVDAYERVSGTAVYPSDVLLPGMLYGAVVRSPHPHARVKAIDASEAEKQPGVRAVLTGTDPLARGVRYPWGRGVERPLFEETPRFEGDVVAAVCADTPYQAADAARAVRVDWEVLPFVVDPERALEAGAPQAGEEGNVISRDRYDRGDVEAGFEAADVVLEETYRTACEIHTPLERHGCVASWDGDRLDVWESTQGVFRVQNQVADALGMPLSRVRVQGAYLGGGFGSKLTAGKYTLVAALLAKKAARPVKLFLPREDTFLATGNRPEAVMRVKAGVKRDGTITALQFHGTGPSGAFPAGGTALLDWLVRDLYTCENVRCETVDVRINAGPARPFRAPGHPQGAYALEQMMDALAQAIDMDPVALRLKNVPERSQARDGNPPYTTTGLAECIRRGAEAFGWEAARSRPKENGTRRRGVGMAASLWTAGGGGPPSTVIVKLFADGSVNLNLGASDIGTGTKTIMAMVVAEELGVTPDSIQIENADTGTTQFATPSGGSKTVPTEAPATRLAAVALKRQLLEWAAEELGVPAAELVYEPDRIAGPGGKSVKLSELSTLQKRGVAVGVGHRPPNPEDAVVNPFAAQFCEVEVDTATGETRILRFVGAHESGRVMNRLTFDNQVFGGIVMGIGLAMTETRVLDAEQTGKMVNRNWHDYKLPTALDVAAEMESVPIEMPDARANAAGAKGLGEPVTIPTAAAVANAIHDALGVRPTTTPMYPPTLVALMREKEA